MKEALNDGDIVDICIRGGLKDPYNHEVLAFSALRAGKYCLYEKPLAYDYRKTWEAHELATKND